MTFSTGYIAGPIDAFMQSKSAYAVLPTNGYNFGSTL